MERKTYCDYLRLIATFAVVVLHVSASNWRHADVNGLEWQSFNFYNSIARWGVPIFVMISGSLFLNRDIPIKKIYGKYILRMAIAYCTWSVFYGLMPAVPFKKGIIYGVKTHLRAIAEGYYHLWFILLIIGIYMCIPFYKKIVSDHFTTKYFIILAFLFAAFIPWSIQLLNDFVAGDNESLIKNISIFNSKISSMSMYMVLGYSFYFVLGYYLDRIELKKKHRMIIYILGIIGFALTVFLDLNLALKTQQPVDIYYGNLRVNVILEVVSVHTWFKYHKFNIERLNSFVLTISRYTFGAYLIHAFIIKKFSSVLNFNTLSFNPIASVPVVSGVVFICALLLSAVLNHIPIINKYCV